MHPTLGVVHNFPKAVGGQDFCTLCTNRSQTPIPKEQGATHEFWSLGSSKDDITLPSLAVKHKIWCT